MVDRSVTCQALDAAVAGFIQARTRDPLAGIAGDVPLIQLAADGKTVRGAKDDNGDRMHLLGVYPTGPGVMLGQREMCHKLHETLHFAPALDMVGDITGALVSVDALHTGLPAGRRAGSAVRRPPGRRRSADHGRTSRRAQREETP